MHRTARYQVPPMPWGIGMDDIASTLKAWDPRIRQVRIIPYRFPRGLYRFISLAQRLPYLRNQIPLMVHVTW
jgi:hypothetical protein